MVPTCLVKELDSAGTGTGSKTLDTFIYSNILNSWVGPQRTRDRK